MQNAGAITNKIGNRSTNITNRQSAYILLARFPSLFVQQANTNIIEI